MGFTSAYLVSGLLIGLVWLRLCHGKKDDYVERQMYDGWYNNFVNPSWGATGDDVIYKTYPAYSDLTYFPSGQDRPNPRKISNAVFAGPSGLRSYMNRTVLFAFFGQMVAYEIGHIADNSCPVEMIKIPVPEDDTEFRRNNSNIDYIPFVRSGYNKKTGQSPNNPRKPTNKATAWIDGNCIYGLGEVWANSLRHETQGLLLHAPHAPHLPGLNKVGLPMENYPNPMDQRVSKQEDMWMFGDSHTHQNPGLMAIGLLFFRYHNHVAREISQEHPYWTNERIFQKARRRVIATLQNIVAYEWLPAMLGGSVLPPYSGYKNHIQPAISAEFESAAFRIGHSFIPPGIYMRNNKCNFTMPKGQKAIRLCNSYWRSQELLTKYRLEDVLMGMSSQIQEREDHVIVDDLRGKSFGPLHFTRHDLVTLTIMRGRDHGLPDYNRAREAFDMEPVTKWEDINRWLAKTNPSAIKKMRQVYNDDLSKLDLYVGGIMESTEHGPGELFSHIILDQFTRIRDGDRFWFENRHNGQLTEEEILEIKKTKLKDVIIAATDVGKGDIQENLFFFKKGDPCPQPKQLVEDDMEACTPHMGYDYFQGSEVSYITSWIIIGLVPFIMIAIAAMIALIRQKKHQKKQSTASLSDWCNDFRNAKSMGENLEACEWTGTKSATRIVSLRFEPTRCSLTLLVNKRAVRTVDLAAQDSVAIWVGMDKRQDTVLIHVPKEYDIVLRMRDESDRAELVNTLRRKLREVERPLHVHQCTTAYIHTKAITKDKRAELIAKFFKGVFAEVNKLDVVSSDLTDDLQINQHKDVVQCELSRAEFAEALCVKRDDLFVTYMFDIIDRDRNGYISFRELMYAVLLLSKGSCEEKLQLLFKMYDQDKSNTLNRREVTAMLRSMTEIGNAKLDHVTIDSLVDELFKKADKMEEGTETVRRSSLMFEDFQNALAPHMEKFFEVCIDWRGIKVCLPKGKKGNASKGAAASSRPDLPSSPKSEIYKRVESFGDAVEKIEQVSGMKKNFQHYIENHRQQIVYLLIFFCISFALFTERFWYYAVEQEHVGSRSIAGLGISTTRGAAAGMCFTYSLLLLTMCRNTITKLRETFLNQYIPFDTHVTFHKIVAWTALFFTLVHVFGYCFNFYQIATQPVAFLCIFDEVFFSPDFLPKFHYWVLNTLVGFTGVLLCIVVAIIYIFATQTARRLIFNAFWATHHFFYALYLLILLHGCTRVVQDPYFPWYFIGPAILFTVDKMVSISRQKRGVSIVRAENLPSDVTVIEFKRPSNFEYKSGQWIRLSCKDLGRDEYHSLTLTSAPHEDTLSVHIRAVGPWTWNIRGILSPENLRDQGYSKLYVDGPFGAGQQDWYTYDVSVLVGAGIGVTPYASILKDFAHMTSIKNSFKIKCHKLYFIWLTRNQKHFEWMIDILKQVEESDTQEKVETHIFITQVPQQYDLRTTMLYICEEHFQKMANVSMFTGLKGKTHFGRPNFERVLEAVRVRHPRVRKVGVFSCGPPGVTKGVQQACCEVSKTSKTRFEHHFENF